MPDRLFGGGTPSHNEEPDNRRSDASNQKPDSLVGGGSREKSGDI